MERLNDHRWPGSKSESSGEHVRAGTEKYRQYKCSSLAGIFGPPNPSGWSHSAASAAWTRKGNANPAYTNIWVRHMGSTTCEQNHSPIWHSALYHYPFTIQRLRQWEVPKGDPYSYDKTLPNAATWDTGSDYTVTVTFSLKIKVILGSFLALVSNIAIINTKTASLEAKLT